MTKDSHRVEDNNAGTTIKSLSSPKELSHLRTESLRLHPEYEVLSPMQLPNTPKQIEDNNAEERASRVLKPRRKSKEKKVAHGGIYSLLLQNARAEGQAKEVSSLLARIRPHKTCA